MTQSFKSLNSTQRFSFLAHFVLAVGSSFLFSFVFSSSVSAFNYGTASWVTLNGGYVQSKTSSGSFDQFLFGIDNSANSNYKQKLRALVTATGGTQAQEVERIRLTFPSGYYTPQKSIAHFSIRFQSLTTNNELGYLGFSPVFSDYTGDSSSGSVGSMLASSCTVLRYTASGTYSGDIQCDYYVYYSYKPTEFNFNGYVFFPAGVTGVIDVEPNVDYIAITNVESGDISSLEADLTTVVNNLSTIISNQNIIGDELRTIESVMRLIRNGQTTPAQIESAVESAISDSGIVDAQRATTNAVNAQTQQQHADYENEVQREEDKEEELEDQAGDLSLSAQNPGNPFASLFNASGCVDMPTVGGWFGNPNLRVCSPYPSTIRFIFDFVGSAIILGFLLRIYIKHFNGGFNT